MFIRVKSRKSVSGKVKKYAYLVESKRRKKSRKAPKQKVIAYIGKVVELKDHKQELNKKQNDFRETLLDLFKDLLLFNGFKQTTEFSFIKEGILVDLADKEVKEINSNQNICLKVNEGFISEYTLSKAFEYKPPEATEKEVGRDLAKMLVSTGLSPTEETFISLYKQISKSFHRK